MKHAATVAIIAGLVLLIGIKVYTIRSFSQYVCGRIRIPACDISAEIYTTEPGTDDGCIPALWNGGKVTCKADLSGVEVGDMADIITFDGGHLVVECVSITVVPAWLQKTGGDVLVINDRYVYRFTRL